MYLSESQCVGTFCFQVLGLLLVAGVGVVFLFCCVLLLRVLCVRTGRRLHGGGDQRNPVKDSAHRKPKKRRFFLMFFPWERWCCRSDNDGSFVPCCSSGLSGISSFIILGCNLIIS
jgi:hypothetical protein